MSISYHPHRSLAGPTRRPLATWILAAGALHGCTVGPDYQPPQTQMPDQWVGTAPDQAAPAGASLPMPGEPDVARWWQTFQDSTLTSLIERGTDANLDVRQAQTRVLQARAARAVTAAGQWPDVNFAAGVSRARNNGGTGNQFRAGFDAAWEMDIFGGTRRAVEASDADLAATVEDERAVRVTLAAEIATVYFDLRGSQQQLVTARRNLELQQKSTDLTKQRFRGGFVSALDVATAESQVASTSSLIPSLEASVRQSVYALGVLLGQEPASLLEELSPEGPVPVAPAQIPVGLPSDLLRRRPDIRAAEWAMHSATARVGVATSDLFPRFSLVGALGIQGPRAGSLTTADNRSWSLGAAVSWPLFSGGRILANIELQKALNDQSYLAYQKAVLVALQEVENALVSFTKEQQRRALLVQAVDADRRALDLAGKLYAGGRTDFLNVLSVQRSLLASEASLVQSDRLIATDLAALYKALGGGWDQDDSQAPAPEPGAAQGAGPASP